MEDGVPKKNLGQPCAENLECVAGAACVGGRCAVAPEDSLGLFDRCVTTGQCREEMYCTAAPNSGLKRCTDPVIMLNNVDFTKGGAPCDITKRQCQPGYFCPDATCVRATLLGMPDGAYCLHVDECQSGYCSPTASFSGLSRCGR